MKTAVANRAEETQTCFPSSKLLPANQFLRAPKAWNYLKEKKKKKRRKKKRQLTSCGLKMVLERRAELSLGLNLVPMCQRQHWVQCLGPNWPRNSHIRRNSSEHQKEARGKLAGEMATKNLLLTHYDPHWTALAFWMVLRAKCASPPDGRTLKFAASCYLLGGTRQNFLAMNPNLPENLKGKNKNGTVIFCLLIEY